MGLFAPSFERRYRAASTIYVAAYTYERLEASEQLRVDQQVYSDMSGALVGFSPIEFQRMWPLALKSAWRVYAMSELGISPAVSGERWVLPPSRRMLWGVITGPNKLYSAFRWYDEATTQAKAYLESQGLELESLDLFARESKILQPKR